MKGGGHGGPPDPRDEGGQGLGQPSLRPSSLTGGPSSQALLLQVADEGREGEGESGGQGPQAGQAGVGGLLEQLGDTLGGLGGGKGGVRGQEE